MYWNYFKYILQHKWYVWCEMWNFAKRNKRWAVGLLWRGLIHDISKFYPAEFVPYAINFFGKKHSTPEKAHKFLDSFEYAWLHHQHSNKHHWNYWVVDQPERKSLPMPYIYMLEMIADWKAMGKKFNDTAEKFYSIKGDNMIIHGETRRLIEAIFRNEKESK